MPISKFVFSSAFLFLLAPTLLAGQNNSGSQPLPYPDCLQHALDLDRRGERARIPMLTDRRIAASALNPDGSLMAIAMADSFWSTLAVFDTASGQQLWRADVATEPRAMELSPDGRVLAIAYMNDSICGQPHLELREARTRARLPTLQEESADGYSGLNDDDVPDVTFSPDGSLVAAIVGSEVRVWTAANGKNRLFIHAPGFKVRHGLVRISNLSFSPDAKLHAGTRQDGKISLWRVPEGSLMKSFRDIRDGAGYDSIMFSPDGKWLAAEAFGPIRIWRVADGVLAGSLNTGMREFLVGFTQDGEKIVTAGDDDESGKHQLEIWDATPPKRGKPLLSYEIAGGTVIHLAHSSGRIVLERPSDLPPEIESVQLTDLDTGKKLSTLILPQRAPEPWFHQGAPQPTGAAQKARDATPRQ